MHCNDSFSDYLDDKLTLSRRSLRPELTVAEIDESAYVFPPPLPRSETQTIDVITVKPKECVTILKKRMFTTTVFCIFLSSLNMEVLKTSNEFSSEVKVLRLILRSLNGICFDYSERCMVFLVSKEVGKKRDGLSMSMMEGRGSAFREVM